MKEEESELDKYYEWSNLTLEYAHDVLWKKLFTIEEGESYLDIIKSHLLKIYQLKNLKKIKSFYWELSEPFVSEVNREYFEYLKKN